MVRMVLLRHQNLGLETANFVCKITVLHYRIMTGSYGIDIPSVKIKKNLSILISFLLPFLNRKEIILRWRLFLLLPLSLFSIAINMSELHSVFLKYNADGGAAVQDEGGRCGGCYVTPPFQRSPPVCC